MLPNSFQLFYIKLQVFEESNKMADHVRSKGFECN